jgi:hypothetical protein
MSKLEDAFNQNSIEKIKTIPQKICEMVVIDLDEYAECLLNNRARKDELDMLFINFKKAPEYFGFYTKTASAEFPGNYKIFLRSTWNTKKMCERKIIDFLKS